MLQAFVVDLFSPHDGSIDLRMLSECFLESDFVENEVSKKICSVRLRAPFSAKLSSNNY